MLEERIMKQLRKQTQTSSHNSVSGEDFRFVKEERQADMVYSYLKDHFNSEGVIVPGFVYNKIFAILKGE